MEMPPSEPRRSPSELSEAIRQKADTYIYTNPLSAADCAAAVAAPLETAVSTAMQSLSLKKGDLVFRKGDPGDAMYLIKSGSVGVFSERDGSETCFADLHRGDFFGEMALLSGGKRSADQCGAGGPVGNADPQSGDPPREPSRHLRLPGRSRGRLCAATE